MNNSEMSLSTIGELVGKDKRTIERWARKAASQNGLQGQDLPRQNAAQEDGLPRHFVARDQEQEVAESIAKKLEQATNRGNQPALFNLEESVAIIRVGNPLLADMLLENARRSHQEHKQFQRIEPSGFPAELPPMLRPSSMTLPIRTELSTINEFQVSARFLYKEAQDLERLLGSVWNACKSLQDLQIAAFELYKRSQYIVGSMNTQYENEYTLGNAAKILDMPKKAFIEYMIKARILQRDYENRIIPTREAYLRGYCKVHTSFFDNGFREVKTTSTRITGRCLARLLDQSSKLMIEALSGTDDTINSRPQISQSR